MDLGPVVVADEQLLQAVQPARVRATTQRTRLVRDHPSAPGEFGFDTASHLPAPRRQLSSYLVQTRAHNDPGDLGNEVRVGRERGESRWPSRVLSRSSASGEDMTTTVRSTGGISSTPPRRLRKMLYAGMPRYAASRSIVSPEQSTRSTAFSSKTNGMGRSRTTGVLAKANALRSAAWRAYRGTRTTSARGYARNAPASSGTGASSPESSSGSRRPEAGEDRGRDRCQPALGGSRLDRVQIDSANVRSSRRPRKGIVLPSGNPLSGNAPESITSGWRIVDCPRRNAVRLERS